MGWLIYNHTPASIRDEIARLCCGEDEARRSYPIYISQKGNVWYAAVRVEPKEGAPALRLRVSVRRDCSATVRE